MKQSLEATFLESNREFNNIFFLAMVHSYYCALQRMNKLSKTQIWEEDQTRIYS